METERFQKGFQDGQGHEGVTGVRCREQTGGDLRPNGDPGHLNKRISVTR